VCQSVESPVAAENCLKHGFFGKISLFYRKNITLEIVVIIKLTAKQVKTVELGTAAHKGDVLSSSYSCLGRSFSETPSAV